MVTGGEAGFLLLFPSGEKCFQTGKKTCQSGAIFLLKVYFGVNVENRVSSITFATDCAKLSVNFSHTRFCNGQKLAEHFCVSMRTAYLEQSSNM